MKITSPLAVSYAQAGSSVSGSPIVATVTVSGCLTTVGVGVAVGVGVGVAVGVGVGVGVGGCQTHHANSIMPINALIAKISHILFSKFIFTSSLF